jgi:DNA invertase Pin-like site-specific DNA recombinase
LLHYKWSESLFNGGDNILNGACYIRVSTEDQTEFSPDAQLKAVKNYAKQNDIILIKEHIYMDEGISGKRADKRPQFMKMIATAKVKPTPFNVILVHKFDRFARSREDSVVYKSLLKKECGVRVISITESIEDDKFSVILEAMLEAMAEYYSLNLAEEVKKGMTEKAERGEYQSTPPLGYTMVNKKLEIVKEEFEIISIIFNKFASREMGLLQISRHLNSLGFRAKTGKPFQNKSIDYILNNPVYIGKTRWTPTKHLKRDWKYQGTIIRDGSHEPIINMETWDKVQARLQENREVYRKMERRNAKISSWLKGIVRCAECGYTFITYNYKYLQCNGYLKGQCPQSSSVPIHRLEAIVLEELKKTYSGEIELNIVPSTADTGASLEYEVLQERLNRISDKEDRVKRAYEDGIDTIEEYSENKIRLSEERVFLINALKSLKENLIENRYNNDVVNKITSVYELLADETISLEQKYQTAHFLIDEITYSKPENTLVLRYK